MSIKLNVLSVGALFFIGQAVFAQEKKNDTTKQETKIGEVVILGYSKTSTKAKSTSSSVTVGAETLENRPNISVLNSIQGTAPGMVVNSASGSPGSGRFNILIRGTSSLEGSTDPLYVVDGVITSGSQFRNLNSYDIETFSILKDAQATAIYGNRAANGVVVITTKGGKFNSGLKVSYDVLTSFSKLPATDYNMSSGKDLLQIQKNLQTGLGNTLTQDQINNWGINTDWTKQFTRIGISQQHNLSITGGGENINNFFSLGYLDSEGTVRSTDFKRFTMRNNLNGKSKNGKLTFGSIIGLGYSRRNQLDGETNTGISNNIIQNPLFGGVFSRPYIGASPYANGQELFNAIKSDTNNREWILQDNINGGIRNRFTELSISANANVNYKITDLISVGNRTGIEYKQYERNFARSPLGYLSIVVSNGDGSRYGGNEDFTTTRDLTFNSITNVTFNKSFGDHTINAAAYMDYIKAHVNETFQSQNGLNPLQWEFGAGTGYIPFNPDTPNIYRPSNRASKVTAGTLAYFGTIDYDYKDKYGVSGVVRRDGSYRFIPANRWETFWSVAVRWNIDKEGFMANSGFKLLKLRGSIGTTGNQNLGFSSDNANLLTLLPNNFIDRYSGISGYQNLLGYNFVNLSNPYLEWEEVKQSNIGLDFNFKGLIEGSVDYYQKRTSRMFNDLQRSSVTGAYLIRGNDGLLDNKGIEGLIKYNVIRTENTRLSIFANAAYNSNKIVSMNSQNLAEDVVNAIGGPAGQYQLYSYVGVNRENGNLQFLDKNGSVTEAPTSADRVLTGKSRFAKFTGGFGFNFQHKGWFLDTLFSFQQGGWIYDNLQSWIMDPSSVANRNLSADLLNSWTPQNKDTDVPALTAANLGSDSSDRFLHRSDFIRLKNINIGYTFTKNQLGKLPVKGIKVFIQAENLLTWTSWKGFDPEPITSYSQTVYPNPKTVSAGLNVDF
jgi:TonB-linked SusC/RagA family outer membrane protein